MKKYRFYMIIGVLLVLYVLITIFRPRETDWTVTLTQKDKNPYGAFILYHRLQDIFPDANIITDRLPVYNQVKASKDLHSAYILIAPKLDLQKEDVKALLNYVAVGNDVLMSSYDFGKALRDTLKFELSDPIHHLFRKDSVRINFTNPEIASDSGFLFRKFTLDDYFKKIDTAHAEVLGVLDNGKPDFIRLHIGKGTIYLHSSPLCFSNYFMLFQQNNKYTATALSYLPKNIEKIYWDEYYKIGAMYSGSLLRFFLMHRFLRWAWWLALFTIIMYLLFEVKRRQRVIPEVDPMSNTSLDFVKTVGNLYFNQQNNKNIAEKKITYFLEFVRSRLFLTTKHLNQEFIQKLSQKSGVDNVVVNDLVNLIIQAETSQEVSNDLLLQLNNQIDEFYKKVK